MNRFEPRLDILPGPQRRLWPELAEVPPHFVLYGGTAIALRLGHRQSLDFDFFSSTPFAPALFQAALRQLGVGQLLQFQANTLTVSLDRGGAVKVSFFGGLSFGRVGSPDSAGANGMRVASLLDLAATKLRVLPERAECRDYLDVFHLIRAGVNLGQALGAARSLYGEMFNPMISLRALSYFADGDLPRLPAEVKQYLAQAASAVRTLTPIARLSDQIA